MVKALRLESSVEAELITRVKAAGGIAEKVTTLGRRGFFDRLIVLPGGRVIFAEVKRPEGGKISPHQIQRHAVYRALGVELRLIRHSKDIDRLLGVE